MKTITALLLVALLSPALSLACSFDTDCALGSKCVKGPGQLYGICAGGSYPGNDSDQQPVYSPLDLNGTYGDTCSSNFDCGIGSKCLKQDGRLKGVCVKRR